MTRNRASRKTLADRKEQRRGTATTADGRAVRGVHWFTVQKPFCAPCRSFVYTALEPYGIPVYNYEGGTNKINTRNQLAVWKIELRTWENLKFGPAAPMYLPMSNYATFAVPGGQAGWAEDLLVKTGKLCISSGHIAGRGADAKWANRNYGSMPTPWDKQAGIERSRTMRVGVLQPPPDGKAWVEKECTKGVDAWQKMTDMKEKALDAQRGKP